MRAVRSLEASGNKAAAEAAQILRDGALVRLATHGGRVWNTVSTDGQRTYLTAQGNCNCIAGLHSRLCKHCVAVQIMMAA